VDRKVTWKNPSTNYCLYGHGLITIDDGDNDLINPQKTKNSHSRSSSTRGLLQDENLEDGNDRN
jgi:hypothetical protein